MRLDLWLYTLGSVEPLHLSTEGTDAKCTEVRHCSWRNGFINQKPLLFVRKMLKAYCIHWRGLDRSQWLVAAWPSLEHPRKGRMQTSVTKDQQANRRCVRRFFWRHDGRPHRCLRHPAHHRDTDLSAFQPKLRQWCPDASTSGSGETPSGPWWTAGKGVLLADPPKAPVYFLSNNRKQTWSFALKVQLGGFRWRWETWRRKATSGG